MTNSRTELLREGLTERGIEWKSGLDGVTIVGDWCFVEYDNGKLAATCEPVLTPEQAVAATLGSGTCECVAEYAKSPFDGKTIVLHRCSECHELMRPHMLYCPNCGAKVVDA